MADMLERIAKLLNQAENAGTQEEATVFMEKAQQLATVHSVDLAKARHATIAKERTVPVQRTIHIGERGTRGLRTLTDLCMNIGQANDLRFTIAHDATRVYAVGFAEDIDITEAMFASLQVQQAKFLAEFKAAATWRDEKIWVETRDWLGGVWKNQTWLTARLNFQEAFASRIGTRLWEAKRAEEDALRKAEADTQLRPHVDEGDLTEHFKQWFFDAHGLNLDEDDSTAQELRHGLVQVRVEKLDGLVATILPDTIDDWVGDLVTEYVFAVADQDAGGSGTELVLVEKRAAIEEAYAPARARARGSYRGGTSGARSGSGQSAGRSAADRASLGRGTAIGGTRGAIGA